VRARKARWFPLDEGREQSCLDGIGQFPAGNPPDAGLQPDVLVVPTVGDIALGRDPELEAVRPHASRERGRRNMIEVGGGESLAVSLMLPRRGGLIVNTMANV